MPLLRLCSLETQQIEHKKSFGKEVIISLVAFANTDGGKVIVGVDDKGNVHGVDVGPETLQRYLNEIKVATYPQLFPKIRIEEKKGKYFLVFEVSEYPIKPVAYKNRYYKRVHNSNHPLTLLWKKLLISNSNHCQSLTMLIPLLAPLVRSIKV